MDGCGLCGLTSMLPVDGCGLCGSNKYVTCGLMWFMYFNHVTCGWVWYMWLTVQTSMLPADGCGICGSKTSKVIVAPSFINL